MNSLKAHIMRDTLTSGDTEWSSKEEIILGVLEMYCQKDIWTSVSVSTKLQTCKLKWDKLKELYEGIRSMSMFNTWVALTSTMLDESTSMLPQFQKLNDACIILKNNSMEISNLQFSFILIKALQDSYSAVASTILVVGETKEMKPQMIQDHILNEEGRRSGASTSLNMIAPIKKKGDRMDKSKIKCFYCQKMGHKSTKYHKKKWDVEEKEKKGER